MHEKMSRVTARTPCPICGRPDWCLIAADAAAAICKRVESRKQCGEAGWLHVLRDGDRDDLRGRRRGRTVEVPDWTPGRADLPILAKQFATAVNPARLDRLAVDLGLTVPSLERLGVGWSHDHGAWSFPMCDAGGRVIGIRLRLPSGKKIAVRGGREGLFLPVDLGVPARLLIAEGTTDAAALLDYGFPAVGRPSCTGGTKLLVDLIRRLKHPEAVIVMDGDEPGQRGAAALASVLIVYTRGMRLIAPPVGVKDVRAWRQAGATAAEVQGVIDAAEVRRLTVSTDRAERLVRHG